MEPKKTIQPSYLEDFSCIGGACEDTCCAGWYIAIDEPTYKKYKKVKDKAMRVRLDKELVEKRKGATLDHVAKIKLKNGRCAFLNKEGWCDIYSQLGENYLSHTCTLYPRAINQINETLEYTLILSCPEAARRILLQREPITFKESDEVKDIPTISAKIQVNSHKPTKWQDYFLVLREQIIKMLQNRDYSIAQRLLEVGKFMEALDLLVSRGNHKKIPTLIEQYKKNVVHFSDILTQTKLNLQKEAEIAIRLAIYLKHFSEEKKLQSKRYLECLEQILEGLGIKDEDNIEIACKCYILGYQTYYVPFIKEKGFILENYLVNYVFERCIPIDTDAPSISFKIMALYDTLIRLQLIGLGNYHQGITEDYVIKLIQAFTKVFDHNDEYLKELFEYRYSIAKR